MELTLTLKAWMLVPAATSSISAAFLVWLAWSEDGLRLDDLKISALLWAALTVPALLVGWLA